jgi:hypothetical protein
LIARNLDALGEDAAWMTAHHIGHYWAPFVCSELLREFAVHPDRFNVTAAKALRMMQRP